MQSSLETEFARIGELQPHLPAAVALLIGLLALAAAAVPALWMLFMHVNTIAHEGAHATMASALGRRVLSVSMKADGTGLTLVQGGERAGTILFQLVGYLGPSLFGLGAAKLIQIGHSIAVLWLGLVLLACLLTVIRRSFGVVTVIGVGVVLFLIAAKASLGAQEATAYAVTWFLLLSGIRVIGEHGAKAGDAGELRKLAWMPGGFWSFLWMIGAVGALIVGAVLLV